MTTDRAGTRRAALRAAADGLCLAAAPAFAIMALLTGTSGGGLDDLLCGSTRDSWPLGGMAPMYGVMSAVHLAPWLRLLAARMHGAGPR